MELELCLLTATALLVSTNARSTVIDFDDPALLNQYFLDGELVYTSPVEVGTSGENGAADILQPPASYTGGPINGTQYLHSSYNSSIYLQASDSSFSLTSLDLGEYSMYTSTTSVSVTGYKLDGSQVTAILDIDGLFDGVGGLDDFQTYLFDDSWSNLTRVEFDDGAYSLDNIQVTLSSVPVPAATWLFGSGLFGLAGIARRKARTASLC